MKVLIVDDSTTARFMISRIIREVGCEVIEASSAAQALSILTNSYDISLTLLDWNMPKMNGIELLEEIRKQEHLKELKIMMVTTETDMKRVVMALEKGANEYVMKPFSKEMLLEKMNVLGFNINDTSPI